jgi:hypothetical protein
MRTIWKFPLDFAHEQRIAMPEAAELLCVQVQHGVPCLWAIVIPDAATVKRTVATYGTGFPMDVRQAENYVGTYQIRGGDEVYHVFID